jgi:hypothetical protein
VVAVYAIKDTFLKPTSSPGAISNVMFSARSADAIIPIRP